MNKLRQITFKQVHYEWSIIDIFDETERNIMYYYVYLIILF